jgi:crotonobetainyl-CoA:carnitine CoA-transferase CaiB-like acyl-CoA transferase
VAGTIETVGPPARLSETPGSVRLPAPLLGEHTGQVLRERLGMTEEEIVRLRTAGVITTGHTGKVPAHGDHGKP